MNMFFYYKIRLWSIIDLFYEMYMIASWNISALLAVFLRGNPGIHLKKGPVMQFCDYFSTSLSKLSNEQST